LASWGRILKSVEQLEAQTAEVSEAQSKMTASQQERPQWFHLNGFHHLHAMLGIQGAAQSNLSNTTRLAIGESNVVLRRQEQYANTRGTTVIQWRF
jgi:hypothetical protein